MSPTEGAPPWPALTYLGQHKGPARLQLNGVVGPQLDVFILRQVAPAQADHAACAAQQAFSMAWSSHGRWARR